MAKCSFLSKIFAFGRCVISTLCTLGNHRLEKSRFAFITAVLYSSSLMTFRDADLLLMRKNLALRSGVHHSGHGLGDAQYSESFSCENWSSNQVNEWLKGFHLLSRSKCLFITFVYDSGIDDSVIPYVKNFEKAGVDGRRLLNFGNDSLRRIGVTREAVRSKILHAIGLLNYYVIFVLFFR